MFHRSWAKCLSTLAILVATSVPAAAAPYKVDFDLAFDIVSPGSSYLESGIKFSPVGDDTMFAPSFCLPDTEYCVVGNDTAYLSTLNQATVIVEREDAQAFSLKGFDASFFPTPWADFSGETFRLLWSGTKLGGGISSGSFGLPGADQNRNYSFAAFADPDMTQLTSLTFSACFFTNGGCEGTLNIAQFALDNLVFDEAGSTVPEPSMLLLMALGLASLTMSRRRVTRQP